MQPSSATLRALLSRRHTRRSRLVLVDGLLDVIEVVGGLMDWQVRMARDRHIRRTANVTVANIARALTPTGPSSTLWPDRLLRIETGVELGDATEYVPVATLLIDELTASTDTARIPFSASSRLRLLDEDFADPISFAAGMRLADMARAVCEIYGLGTSDALYDLDDDGIRLGSPRSFTSRDRGLSALVDTFFVHGLDFADDALGRIWAAPLPTVPGEPVWTFSGGAGATLTRLEAKYRHQRVYNRVNVRGVGPDHEPVTAVARDLNPASPTYNPPDGSGPLGDRPYPVFESGGITEREQAQRVADALLLRVLSYEVVVGASSIVIPGLEDRDVARQEAIDDTGVDDVVTLDSVALGHRGEMQMSGRVSRSPASPFLTLTEELVVP